MLNRKNREEKEDPQSKMVKGERLRWSEWREAIVPEYIGAADERLYSPRTARRGITTHYYNEKTRHQLLRQCRDDDGDCSGVYELKV